MKIWGVTFDSVDKLDAICTMLNRLPVRMTSRIVFDEEVPAKYYLEPLKKIKKVSYVMGELLDSYYLPTYSVDRYLARAKEYYELLSPYVDIWEVGNEINGEWCGKEVVEKISKAHTYIKSQGKKTALTFYYNQGCWDQPSHEMFTWIKQQFPSTTIIPDYALVSYYEDDCNALKPDWQSIFNKLGAVFPHAGLGIGECGTKRVLRKSSLMKSYYEMKIMHPRFIGGYFWWYGFEHLVPYNKFGSLFPTLTKSIQKMTQGVQEFPERVLKAELESLDRIVYEDFLRKKEKEKK